MQIRSSRGQMGEVDLVDGVDLGDGVDEALKSCWRRFISKHLNIGACRLDRMGKR
jgi:hypothetical protein